MRKPTFSFENGILTVDGPLTTYRLRWSPEPLAEELLIAPDKWTACWPDFRILKPQKSDMAPPNDEKASAFYLFRKQIPNEMAAAVERFDSHQWALLLMLHRQPLSLDLAVSNPVLAYALANNNNFRGTRRLDAAEFQAASYSLRKQRWILEWLGFPGTGAIEKIFRKIQPGAVSLPLLRLLKYTLQENPDASALLNHQRIINESVLQIVTNPHILEFVSPSLLDAVAASEPRQGERTIGDQIADIKNILKEIAPHRPIQAFRSIRQVKTMRDEVDAEYIAHHQRLRLLREQRRIEAEQERQRQQEREVQLQKEYFEKISKPFPHPPLPGTESIIPITCLPDLQLEGQTQNNCVASYALYVIQGGFYVYRVTAPERATLSITKGNDGCWKRCEIKVINNGKPKRSSVNAVDRWLLQHNHSV